MGKFPGFGSWINQNTQQSPESKRSENVKAKSMSEINTHEASDEMMKEQLKLWRVAEKKEQWNDVPAKVKVETEVFTNMTDMFFSLLFSVLILIPNPVLLDLI